MSRSPRPGSAPPPRQRSARAPGPRTWLWSRSSLWPGHRPFRGRRASTPPRTGPRRTGGRPCKRWSWERRVGEEVVGSGAGGWGQEGGVGGRDAGVRVAGVAAIAEASSVAARAKALGWHPDTVQPRPSPLPTPLAPSHPLPPPPCPSHRISPRMSASPFSRPPSRRKMDARGASWYDCQRAAFLAPSPPAGGRGAACRAARPETL